MAKQGRTLQELAAELVRQQESKKDYIAPQGAIEAVVLSDASVALTGLNGGPKTLTPYAHGQLADHLGITKKYYDRMLANKPDLLAENVNVWLRDDPQNMRLVRTLDQKVRGILSSKFRPLDNFDLAQVVIPELDKLDATIVSCELTETRLYIKAILPALSDTIPVGHTLGEGHFTGLDRGTVVAAIVISNSDIGAGTLRIEPSVFTTFCTNLAVLKQAAMRKYHVGRAGTADEQFEVYRDDTREADDKAFWLKVRDITIRAFDPAAFTAAVAQLKGAAETPITSNDLPTVVEVAVRQLALPTGLGGNILTALAAGGDLTKWGLSSAITRVANDVADYEDATLLERAGGAVITLDRKEWAVIADAKKA